MRIASCKLCPRQCGVTREPESGNGYCGMGADPVVARAALHFWEEPCISGTRGSGTVFFTGCSLRCAYCQNYSISTERGVGERVSIPALSDVFLRLEAEGAHNINLVNPTHFASAIAEALALRPLSIPVVYNSGGYESVETLRMLEGLVSVYLPDMKYEETDLARKLSGAADYPKRAHAALLEMARQTGPLEYGADGLLRRGTVVRHLILPGHTRNSIAVLDWLAANMPQGVLVSLMAQYIPCGRAAEFPEINRKITQREYDKVESHLFSLPLDGFVQDRSAAKKAYIPPWRG